MTVWTHIGNGPLIGITPTPDIQKHKQSMEGQKSVDFINLKSQEFAFNCKADEWTVDNVQMALRGQLATDTTGEYMKIGAGGLITRQIKFVGTNKVGPRFEVILPRVSINAKDAIEFISENDDTVPLPLSGDVLFDPTLGAFGTARALAGATGSAPVTGPDTLNYYTGLGNIYTAPVA